MKKKAIITALLMMLTLASFAQVNTQTDAEKLLEYQNRVRQTLQLDYSMPDYSATSINSRVMGDRLAKILNKTLEMCQSQTNLGALSVIKTEGLRV